MGRRGRPRKVRFELERDSAHSIAAVVLLLAAALTLLSFFGQAAGFGSLLQQVLNKIFGWGTFAIPLILTLSGLILAKKTQWKLVKPRILSGITLFLISFLAMTHFFFPPGVGREEALMGQGGGLLGYSIQKHLKAVLGPFGASLILTSLLLVSILVIFNASLDETLVFLGKVGSIISKFFQSYILRTTTDSLKKVLGKDGQETLKPSPSEEETDAALAEEEKVKPLVKWKTKAGEVEVVKATYAPAGAEEENQRAKKGPSLRHETVANLPSKQVAWRYPPLDLLHDVSAQKEDQEAVKRNAQIIEDSLESFGIKAKVAEINVGPSVTQYALEAAAGTKLTRITTLQRDLAMALASSTGSVRIEAPIPGRSLVGIEVPNAHPSLVSLKSILTSKSMQDTENLLAISLGKDVAGRPIIADISRMPHILIAGSTGSGKSILIHSLITTLLFRTTPEEVRLILADPKRVELSIYRGIPHLLTPVILDSEKMLPALKWSAGEMDRRYRLFENAGAKDISSYNELSGFQALPYIIFVIDELADVMTAAANEVEKAVVRLAQMSRATGVHLILSTQRPSTDVLTGLIKANIPCRIALNTASGVDSRVIIDQPGAEKLLGRGDMLYLPPEASKPKRIQGVFVSLSEITALVNFLKEKNTRGPDFEDSLEQAQSRSQETLRTKDLVEGIEDRLLPEAVEIVCRHGRASASLLQRRLAIGYARAARLLDTLEAQGIVGPKDGSRPREVLIFDPSEAA